MAQTQGTVEVEIPSRPGPGTKAKRAAVLADRIIEDVMSAGWPVGEVLGSEVELLDRYQVSRAVFREAVRLLEHLEVARTRRGPGGGLVITEPTVGTVIEAVVLYLLRVDARLDEVFEARIVLEELAAGLAARRFEENDLDRLRQFVGGKPSDVGSDTRNLHSLVAESTHNPALDLFIEVLNRVATLYTAGWRFVGKAAEIAHAHSRIAEAVIAGDAATARRRMRKHLEAEADYLRRRRSTRQELPGSVLADPVGPAKRAETLARKIAHEVVAQGMRPGYLIGTESDLIEQEKVSRAVLREAVRLLEYHQIARMRRGPGGGLFVVEPAVGAVTDVVAIYLVRERMALAQLSEMRTGVEMAIVDLAVSRVGADGSDVAERLAQAVAREAEADDEERAAASHDLHAVLAAVAGNRVLELVALVLIRLSRLHQVERLAPVTREQIQAEVLRAHSSIAAAVSAGDRDLSRHRMQRHLDALGEVIR